MSEASGQLVLRMPKGLHERTQRAAKDQGVSLNSFLLTLVAEGMGRYEALSEGNGRPEATEQASSAR